MIKVINKVLCTMISLFLVLNISVITSYANTESSHCQDSKLAGFINEEHQAGGFCYDDTIRIDEKYKYFLEVKHQSQIDEIVEEYNLKNKEYSVSEDVDEKIIVQVDLTIEEAKDIRNNLDIVGIEKNYNVNGCAIENTSQSTVQWYLDAINVPLNTENTNSEKTVKVELLDSGVSYVSSLENVKHIDLTGDNNTDMLFNDNSGHGTSLAGIICADPNNGDIQGINPNAELYSVKVLDENLQAPISKIIEGIYWGIENDMDIINMSFGTTVKSEILHQAVIDANNAGVLLIASAGNDDEEGVLYPAAYPEVMAVGSTDSSGDLISEFANGDEIEILAPGNQIVSTGELNGYISGSGTSLSTAQVSGVASLLLQNEGATSEIIRDLMVTTGKAINDTNAKLLDYKYALENYESFVTEYKSDELLYENYCNNSKSNSYDNNIVNGLWDYDTHVFLVNKSNENTNKVLDTTYLQCIKHGAKKSDAFKSVYMNNYFETYISQIETQFEDLTYIDEETNKIKYYVDTLTVDDDVDFGGLHGLGSYTVNLKALWLFADYIKQGQATHVARGNVMNVLSSQEELLFKNVESFSYASYVKSTTEGMLRVASAFLKWVKSDEDLSNLCNTNIKEQYLVYGLIFHFVGDVYAHRTLVPDYAFDNAKNIEGDDYSNYYSGNSQDGMSWLVTTHFSNWTDVYSKKGRLQYTQLTSLAKSNLQYGFNALYEDNQDFSRERLSKAVGSCTKLMQLILSVNSVDINEHITNIIQQHTYVYDDVNYPLVVNIKHYSSYATLY